MKPKRRLLLIASAAALVIVGLVLWLSKRHEQLYKVTVLPSLGVTHTIPVAINDRGQVAVTGSSAGATINLFIWDRENGMQDLGLRAVGDPDINNAGQIAGTMIDPNGNKQAFFWDPNDGIQLLGTHEGTKSFANALNNGGQVVGFSQYIGDQQAFIWDKTKGMRNITPDEQPYAKATAINDAGQILGEISAGYDLKNPKWSPFYLDLTDPKVTLTATDMFSQDNPLTLEGINNNGYVLARTRRRRKGSHWFCLWHKDAGLKWLFPVESPQGPFAFNDANEVLYSEQHLSPLRRLSTRFFPSRTLHCLWDQKRGKVVLNKQVSRKIGYLVYVADINNRGCIVGWISLQESGQLAGVLLEPIPERGGK